MQQQTKENQLSVALTSLSRATKKSKTFETQHLIRKIKSIKLPKNNKPIVKLDLPTLEADLLSLKSIDVQELSKKYLYIRLKRQASELINHPLFEDLQSSPEPITFNRIENKICSRKSLADLINLTTTKLISDKNDHVENKHSKKSTNPSTSNQPDPSHKKNLKKIQPNLQHQDISDDEDLSGDELDEAVARELEALGAISHQESEEEDSDEQSDSASSSQPSNHPPLSSKKSNTKTSLSRTKKQPGLEPSKPLTCSTFLPALNVGFTLGHLSDQSDLDDLNDPFLDKMERERDRKNRRGQRARRAIWEKKFGKSAKHLIKLKQKSNTTDTRKRDNESYQEGQKPFGKKYNDRNHDNNNNDNNNNKRFKPSITGSNLEPIAPKTKVQQDQYLHPSWIAKQNLLHAASIIKPAGKKTVFT